MAAQKQLPITNPDEPFIVRTNDINTGKPLLYLRIDNEFYRNYSKVMFNDIEIPQSGFNLYAGVKGEIEQNKRFRKMTHGQFEVLSVFMTTAVRQRTALPNRPEYEWVYCPNSKVWTYSVILVRESDNFIVASALTPSVFHNLPDNHGILNKNGHRIIYPKDLSLVPGFIMHSLATSDRELNNFLDNIEPEKSEKVKRPQPRFIPFFRTRRHYDSK